ncbi:MAG: Uma2 family endonuclease [Chloroflexota bacterium]|nr:Uma2 family endonuclease [Chloroflexota bacterium]
MSILTRPLTYDDLCLMPNDGHRYEIIDGELLVSPTPSRNHQKVAARLHLLLGNLVEANGAGEVYFAPVDVRLTPHDVVQPDLLFIRADRLGIYQARGVVEGPPDLVVEILSPANRTVDQVRKAALYARAGVPEYWIVDPDSEELVAQRLVDGQYEPIMPINRTVHSGVVPELTVDVSKLFADLD